jgi:O-antigen/teichoic acid export membrane protein
MDFDAFPGARHRDVAKVSGGASVSSESRSTFFRQSGWMFFATLASGIFMFGVHPVYAPILGEKGYGDFQAILWLLTFIGIPGIGLQGVFAQQTAAAISAEEKRTLTLIVQTVLRWTFFIWLAMTLIIAIFHEQIMQRLKLPGYPALGIAVALGLAQLWTPILSGILQGSQKFFWLGWSTILSGVGRFAGIGIILILLHGGATGSGLGVLIGTYVALSIAAYHSREIWFQPGPGQSFAMKEWLRLVLPLTIGLGASQFIYIVDYFVVRDLFGEDQTGSYAFAGTIGRGIVLFTAPVSAVMFPKIVHNFSHKAKSNVLLYAFLGTAGLGVIAAAFCTVIAMILKHVLVGDWAVPLPASIIGKLQGSRDYLTIVADLLPWFVWGMLPLAVANVLLNNLMARRRFRVVIYLVALAIVYTITLRAFGMSFLRFAQILGFFNVLCLALMVIFTWLDQRQENKAAPIPA